MQTPQINSGSQYQPRKLQAASSDWIVEQALRKQQAPSNALMSVNISKRQDYLQEQNDPNSKGMQTAYERPMTAKPLPKGEPIAVKQMIFFDDKNSQDIEGQVRDALRTDIGNQNKSQKTLKPNQSNQSQLKKQPSQSNQIIKHQNRLNDAKQKQQSTYYKSQFHYDEDFDQARESKMDRNLVVAGSEMHIELVDQARLQRNQGVGTDGGVVGVFNMQGGQQAKAMPATLRTSNANRFYKGYQKKLAEHQEETKQHFQSIYGLNQDQQLDKQPIKKQRPQTAKVTNKAGLNRQTSAKKYIKQSGAGSNNPPLSFKAFTNFSHVDQEQEMKRQRSIKNLEQMYGKSEKIEQYYNDKEMLQKRDDTKKELKQLLKKYMADSDHNNICAMRVGHAQREVNVLHERMEKAVKSIEGYETQFEQTKRDVHDMNDYLQKDRFIADEFGKNIERNIKNARIAWTSDTQSVNERIRQYEELFDDPSRMPHYDEKARVWNLSSKFDIEENDHGADDDAIVMSHPFLNKRL